MRFLEGNEFKEAEKYFRESAILALNSKCLKDKCGSVIVHKGGIIGKGWNSPPNDKSVDYCIKEILPANFKSEKHCCLHAEQRAVMDALKNYPDEIKGSTIYFTRIDSMGSIINSGDPYCTICSKFVLDNGVKEFVLWHKKGIAVYDTEEYNKLSFKFK